MSSLEKYELDIFGQKFVLSTSDGKTSELKKVADYYKSVVENLSKKLPDRQLLDIAILAGIKITDKLYSVSNSNSKSEKFDDGQSKIHDIVDDAIKRLDISLRL
jgi:cell division protein ZapA (FtsZ GTPase activity inhibitor)